MLRLQDVLDHPQSLRHLATILAPWNFGISLKVDAQGRMQRQRFSLAMHGYVGEKSQSPLMPLLQKTDVIGRIARLLHAPPLVYHWLDALLQAAHTTGDRYWPTFGFGVASKGAKIYLSQGVVDEFAVLPELPLTADVNLSQWLKRGLLPGEIISLEWPMADDNDDNPAAITLRHYDLSVHGLANVSALVQAPMGRRRAGCWRPCGPTRPRLWVLCGM